jgi:hypothetical protein
MKSWIHSGKDVVQWFVLVEGHRNLVKIGLELVRRGFATQRMHQITLMNLLENP